MIGAILHRLLYRWILRVPSKNFGEMPLLAISDIPLWVIFRGDWFKLIRKLSALQKNLKARKWSGLGVVYPRFGVLAYVYYLFSWAQYCDRTNEIIEHPDESLFAEVFLSYICQIDLLIDQPDSVEIWKGNNINKIKLSPGIAATASELCSRINTIHISREKKGILVKQITTYRRNALQAMRHWASNKTQSLEETLAHKKITACNLLPQWCDLLNIVYDVPENVAKGVHDIFLNFSFLVQIIDDVADVAADYRNNVQNILAAVVSQNEIEWARLQKIIDKNIQFVGWKWVRENLPESYKQLKLLYRQYAEKLKADEHNPHLAFSMFAAIDQYRSLMELNQ